jgi:lipopolysaccharide export system permease protein
MAPAKINKYIIKEIAGPTLIGMLIFTLVVLMGRMIRLVEMVLNKGVPVGEIALLFLYMMPAFMVITLPLAFLMGILLAFGRLSSDAEITALKASGVSLQQMLKPVFVVAVVTALLTAVLSIYAAPASNSAFRSKVYDIATQKADVGIEPQVFNADFDGLVLFANQMDQNSGVIDGIFISDERTTSTPSIITAKTGRIHSDPVDYSLSLHLVDGSIHRKSRLDSKESYQVIDFSTYDINLDIGNQLAPQGKRRIKEKELSIAALIEQRNATGDQKRRQQLSVELVNRFVLPFSPLIFALVGVPLGIQTTRSGRGGGFALGLLVFLVYYMLFSLTKTLAIDAGLSPYIVIMPTLIFLFGGGYMLNLAMSERRLVLLDRLQESIYSIFKRKKKE